MMLHRKVQCWIFSKDSDSNPKCLLLKTNQARGEFWQPVTGTVEPGEGIFEAACREPSEETGFIFSISPVDTGYEFEFISRLGRARERVFALFVDEMPLPKLDPKEHDDFQWISPNEALGLLKFPSNIEGLQKAYKLIFQEELRKDSQT